MISFTIGKTMENTVTSLRGEARVVLVKFLIATHCVESIICQSLAKHFTDTFSDSLNPDNNQDLEFPSVCVRKLRFKEVKRLT